eukprot:scaffold19193_cov62-Phaeocystis_antarctica.AAC.3
MVLPRLNSVKTSIFTASEGGWGRASGIGCAVEVRDGPELFRVVVRIGRGFETTGIEPWTYLLSPGRLVLKLPQQRLHYSPRLLPIPPTYKLNGSSFGRPDVDLMFAKWAFNNVGESPQTYAQSDRCPIWSSLGLSATADVSWDVNDEGVATSAFGLRLTVAAMLKLGALYLQGGLSTPSTRLLSQSWASTSTQSQTQYSPWGTAGVCDTLNGYGYQWWVQRAAAGSDYYCAIGYMGQFVCVYPSLDAVLAVVAQDYSYADPCRLVRMVSDLSLPAVDGDCSPGPLSPPSLPLPSGTPLSPPPTSTTPATTARQPQVPQPPTPPPPPPPSSATLSSSPDSSTVATVAGGVAGGVVVLLLAASAVFVLHRYNRREEEEGRLPARFAATARSSFVI